MDGWIKLIDGLIDRYAQALQGKDITIYGDGQATRSFQVLGAAVGGGVWIDDRGPGREGLKTTGPSGSVEGRTKSGMYKK